MSLLEINQIGIQFGGLRVLSGITFNIEENEILGVIGPNGCGKTTMFNALIGLIMPTQGEIIYDGKNVTKMKANDRCRLGIGRTYQVPRPFEGMSVYENCLVAAVHGAGHSEKEGRRVALDALKLTELYDKREVRAGELTLLDRKRLEIARALAPSPSCCCWTRWPPASPRPRCRMS